MSHRDNCRQISSRYISQLHIIRNFMDNIDDELLYRMAATYIQLCAGHLGPYQEFHSDCAVGRTSERGRRGEKAHELE
jgi:hypothetical protein